MEAREVLTTKKMPRDRREGWKQNDKEGRKEQRRWVSAKMETP